tara:strand:+ start:3660 stop:3893 length:234 start_codon:yes stop_codon:yes gene_type:complete
MKQQLKQETIDVLKEDVNQCIQTGFHPRSMCQGVLLAISTLYSIKQESDNPIKIDSIEYKYLNRLATILLNESDAKA